MIKINSIMLRHSVLFLNLNLIQAQIAINDVPLAPQTNNMKMMQDEG
jgi:hypothetical protein